MPKRSRKVVYKRFNIGLSPEDTFLFENLKDTSSGISAALKLLATSPVGWLMFNNIAEIKEFLAKDGIVASETSLKTSTVSSAQLKKTGVSRNEMNGKNPDNHDEKISSEGIEPVEHIDNNLEEEIPQVMQVDIIGEDESNDIEDQGEIKTVFRDSW